MACGVTALALAFGKAALGAMRGAGLFGTGDKAAGRALQTTGRAVVTFKQKLNICDYHVTGAVPPRPKMNVS